MKEVIFKGSIILGLLITLISFTGVTHAVQQFSVGFLGTEKALDEEEIKEAYDWSEENDKNPFGLYQ